MVDFSGGPDDKLSYFQAITGLEDRELCQEILAAHNWDLELAISSFTASNPSPEPADAGAPTAVRSDYDSWEGIQRSDSPADAVPPPPGLAWKLVTLPFSVVSSSLGLISGAVGLGVWVAGGVLSHSLGLLGWGSRGAGGSSSSSTTPLVSLSAAAAEALDFVNAFEREYGSRHPNFVAEGFMDALQRARR